MFWDLMEYDWVLDIYDYNNLEELLTSFEEKVINPAEAKVEELLEKKFRLQEKKSTRRKRKPKL